MYSCSWENNNTNTVFTNTQKAIANTILIIVTNFNKGEKGKVFVEDALITNLIFNNIKK